MHAADLPHAVFLHVFILVYATADTGIHAMAALHAEFANTGQCTLAIGRDMHDRLILEVVEYFPLMQPLWTEDVQELAYARLAFVNAALRNLDAAVVGKQGGDVIPLPAIEVVAVGVLQILHGARILEARQPRRELGKRGSGGRWRHARRGIDGAAG